MEIKLTDKLNNLIESIAPKDKSTQLALAIGILALGVLLPASLLTAAFIAKAIKITAIVIILASAYFTFSGGSDIALFFKWAKPKEPKSLQETVPIKIPPEPLTTAQEMNELYNKFKMPSTPTPSLQATPSLEEVYQNSKLTLPKAPSLSPAPCILREFENSILANPIKPTINIKRPYDCNF